MRIFALNRFKRASSSKGRLAFTVLEIMIAIAILGLIFSAIYSSWTAVVRSSKAGLDAAAKIQRTRMAMRCMVDSLLCLQMYAANWDYYSFVADTSSDYAYLSFVARLPASFPHSGMFGDQVMRRVTFTVEPGPNSQNQLVMYQMPLLSETNNQQQPVPVVLAREINRFTLDFWGAQTNDWAADWLKTNQIPKLVRITLAYGQGGAYNRQVESYTRVIALPGMLIPAQYQMAPGANAPIIPPGPGAMPGGPMGPGGPGMPNSPGLDYRRTTGPPGLRNFGGGDYDGFNSMPTSPGTGRSRFGR